MKNLQKYLKSSWPFMLLYIGLFLISEAYVYPELRFDFTQLLDVGVWLKVFLNALVFNTIWYFVFWKRNFLSKEEGNLKK